MEIQQIKKVLDQLADHERRISVLEEVDAKQVEIGNRAGMEKQKTLREIVKGRKFRNGPEKLVVIVGYHEKILGSLVHKNKFKEEWGEAKLDGTYKTNLLDDAKGHYIRVQPSGECDLTQTGEEFFANFLKDNAGDS